MALGLRVQRGQVVLGRQGAYTGAQAQPGGVMHVAPKCEVGYKVCGQ